MISIRSTISLIVVVFVGLLLLPLPVSAASDFQAGRIIDDAVFIDKGSMTPTQIQNFLNSKMPVCDTWGTQSYGGTTRAQYAASRGVSTPFICLKDYYENGKIASQIIYDVAQKYSINPQVLIVLLQKEQGLLTDDWPWPVQYRAATGYGCPDTAPCDSQYYGLTNQLDWAAKMFRAIINDSPTWYTPYELGNNYIQYSPDGNCGGSVVNIQNRATQALYNYTPYQPSQAAIDAGWGTVPCGAYGNRNFYLYFTSWFGSTRGGDLFSYDIIMNTPITMTPLDPRAGDSVTVTFGIKNISNTTQTYGNNLLQCRIENSINCDSTVSSGGSLTAGATRTLSYTITPSVGGSMVIKPYFVNFTGAWNRYAPSSSASADITTLVPHLRATGPLSYSPKRPNVGETIRFSVPIINNGTVPLTISTSLIQCRLNGVTNCDTPMGGADTIAPGATRTYDYAVPITQAGDYTFVAYYNVSGKWYKYIFLDAPLVLSATDITLNGPLSVNDSDAIPNQPISTSYTLINNGSTSVTLDSSITQCRFNATVNCDPSSKPSVTLPAGATTTVIDTFKSATAGSYRFMPYYSINGEYHAPRTASPTAVTVRPYTADMRVTDFSVNNPEVGDPLNVTYTVKNFGMETAYYQSGVLQCRLGSINCDSPYVGIIDIPANATRTFTEQLASGVSSGKYTLTPYFMQNNSWYAYKSADGSSFGTQTVTVQRTQPQLLISNPIVISNQTPRVGDDVTVSYTITNTGSSKINILNWVTQCRINSTVNCDNTWGNGFTLNVGQSTTLSGTHRISQAGSYKFVPYVQYDGGWYSYSGNTSATSVAQ